MPDYKKSGISLDCIPSIEAMNRSLEKIELTEQLLNNAISSTGITSEMSLISSPADGFGLIYEPPKEKTHQIVYDLSTQNLHNLYERFSSIVGGKNHNDMLEGLWDQLTNHHPNDWLLPVEIYEFTKSNNKLKNLSEEVKHFLLEKRKLIPESAMIIDSLFD